MNALGKFFLNLLCGFLALWPRSYVRLLGRPMGILWFDILRIRRRVVLENLKIAFPEWTEAERVQAGRRSVYQMTENFFELLLIPSMSKSWLDTNVVLEGLENLDRVLSQGRGVYCLSLHLANGDMGSSALARLGYSTYLITKKIKNKLINDLWFSVRGATGVRFIDAHGPKTAFEILKAIKTNSLVVFVNDQFMGKPFGLLTKFFGKETGTAFGLAVFYLKTKTPIVPVYNFDGADGKIHVVAEPALQLDHLISEDKELSYQLIIQEINDVLEKIIRKHPSQWMWVHRRWKTFE